MIYSKYYCFIEVAFVKILYYWNYFCSNNILIKLIKRDKSFWIELQNSMTENVHNSSEFSQLLSF